MRVSGERVLSVLAVATIAASLWAAQSSSKQPEGNRHPAIDPGRLDGDTYHNAAFGFRYKLSFGWVDRSDQMREESSEKSLLLLAAFERPPEAAGDSVNSAVVITAENVSVYPGLKAAADYFAPLTEVTDSKGFHVVNQPYYFEVGSKQVVRGDFSKQIDKRTMYQSSLVMLDKGYVVSFTFLGGSQDEVAELITHLNFNSPPRTRTKD
jgi:hypothetical protein